MSARVQQISAYAPREYRKWLADKFRPLARTHGLGRAYPDPTTGTVRCRALRPAVAYDAEPILF
jgi:plasmid stabilization system protein ParE